MSIIQRIIHRRKLNFFGHICRMRDDRLLKQVLFGKTDGKSKSERPNRRWTDTRPFGGLVHERYLQLVQNGGRQNQLVRYIVDTVGQ